MTSPSSTLTPRIAAALLHASPSAEIVDVLAGLGGAHGRGNGVRASDAWVRRHWNGGKAGLEEACEAIRLCGSGDLLTEIARRDRRQGVRSEILTHPKTPIETLCTIAQDERNGWELRHNARRYVRAWVRGGVVTPALTRRLLATEYAGCAEELAIHPGLDPESAAALLDAPQVSEWDLDDTIAARPDIAALNVTERLIELGRTDNLLRNEAVGELGEASIRTLIERGNATAVAEAHLGEEWSGAVIAELTRRDVIAWDALARCRGIDAETLGNAPVRNARGQVSARISGRYLALTCKSSPPHWRLAVELLGTVQGSHRELFETLVAVLGPVPDEA